MNTLSLFVLFAILLECATASEDTLEVAFEEAVDERNFEWLDRNLRSWWGHEDLFDGVIAKGVDVTVWFIQNVKIEKRGALAALFDKGEKGMIDGVLERIKYDDKNLVHVIYCRKVLAGSPEKFFRVLDKIKAPERQEIAVRRGVRNLFEAGKHDLVVPLVNALGTRTFKSDRLKDLAIRRAFYEGAKRGNQDMVGLYCGHPAITSERYASGLCNSWDKGKPNQVSRFLLEQADQGDLDVVKEGYGYKNYPEFRQAIDEALKTALTAGSRHLRLIERAIAKLAMNILGAVYSTNVWHQEPGSILAFYLVGEEIWAREIEKVKLGKQEAPEVEEGRMSKMCRIL